MVLSVIIPHLCRWRVCYTDEHYIPTVLARWGLDDETDCAGTLVSGNWSSGEGHPHSYEPHEVTAQLCAPHPPLQSPKEDLAFYAQG